MIHISRSLAVRLGLLVTLVALLSSCSTPFRDMTATERAKEITRLRKEGKVLMSRYLDSELVDLVSLEKTVDLLEKSTEVGSTNCPSCFLEYATYLSMLGHHYRFLYSDLEEAAEQADSRGEAEELTAEAEEYRERMVRYFRESNKSYRTYFRSARAVDPVFFLRVAKHYQFMEEWDAALRHLEIFEDEARNLLSTRQKREVKTLKRQVYDKSKRDLERPRDRDLWRDTELRLPSSSDHYQDES